MKILKYLLISFLAILALLFLIIKINQFYLKPTKAEIQYLEKEYGSINIRNVNELYNLQNKVVDLSKFGYVHDGEIIIQNVTRKGLCYDRSLILQKIMVYNNIPFRPVYLYYGGRTNTFIDLVVTKNLGSHSVFEFKLNDQYFVMKTNQKMYRLETMSEYLKSEKTNLPKTEIRYIRYLSNRNGRFVRPSWLPDIYYFN